IVQPWMTARWPIATRAPTRAGNPGSQWMIVPSCTFDSTPTRISSESARSTAYGQIDARSPSRTRPQRNAAGCTNAVMISASDGVEMEQPWTLTVEHLRSAPAAMMNRSSPVVRESALYRGADHLQYCLWRDCDLSIRYPTSYGPVRGRRT